MKILLYATSLSIFFTGCSNFTFEPEHTPPKSELEQIIQSQQSAMTEQEEAVLNK